MLANSAIWLFLHEEQGDDSKEIELDTKDEEKQGKELDSVESSEQIWSVTVAAFYT